MNFAQQGVDAPTTKAASVYRHILFFACVACARLSVKIDRRIPANVVRHDQTKIFE